MMTIRRLSNVGVVCVVGISAFLLLSISVPRVVANTILFPEKTRLAMSLPSEEDAYKVLDALDRAISWSEEPRYFYLKERTMGRLARSQTPSARHENYEVRVNLLEDGLTRGGLRPYEFVRLANLRTLAGWEASAAMRALNLSVETGQYVRVLAMPRFKTLYRLWDKLDATSQQEALPIVQTAYRVVGRRGMVDYSRDKPMARAMIRKALRDNPRELLAFVQATLKRR